MPGGKRKQPESFKAKTPGEAASLKSYRAAVSKFRPAKSDRGKIVLIGAAGDIQGKRQPLNTRRAVYAVYIPKSPSAKHKVYALRERRTVAGKKSRQYSRVPRARSGSSLDLYDTPKKYQKAVADLYKPKVKGASERDIGRYSARSKPGRELNWQTVSAKMVEVLWRTSAFTFGRADIPFIVRLEATFEVVGKLHTIRVEDIFRRPFGKAEAKIQAYFEPMIRRKLWALLAQELDTLNLVSKGSTRFIKNLALNKGKNRKNWVKRNGKSWEKKASKEAVLISVNFEVIPIYRS